MEESNQSQDDRVVGVGSRLPTQVLGSATSAGLKVMLLLSVKRRLSILRLSTTPGAHWCTDQCVEMSFAE